MEKINVVISNILNGLESRKKDVLVNRFGLASSKPMTLQAIGDKYGVTRERIRQIESLALSDARLAVASSSEVDEILNAVDSYLTEKGGVALETDLYNDMKGKLSGDVSLAQLSFLRDASKRFGYQPDNNHFYAFWYNNDNAVKKTKDFVTKFASVLKNKKEDVVTHGKFDDIFKDATKSHSVDANIGLNYLSVSKKFTVSPYGDRGLSSWPEVNPATIRDWSYLVLKKANKPLHFEEIATHISGVHSKKKKVFTPTVHNELIKDKRFVLVGRGMYGLTEFGYETGNIKSLIQNTLSKNGALSANKIIDLVSEQRMFKKNTILLHLQDKKMFKKDKNGDYLLA